MLLAYAHDGSQPRHRKVGCCVDKALQLGAALLAEVGTAGADSSRDASLGCRAGLSKAERPGLELWTMKLLSRCEKHPSKLAPGTVWKILSQQEIRPHKISHYLERRDPERKNR